VLDFGSGLSGLCGLAAVSTCARYTYHAPAPAYRSSLRSQVQRNAAKVVVERLRITTTRAALHALMPAAHQQGGPLWADACVLRMAGQSSMQDVQQALLAMVVLGGVEVAVLLLSCRQAIPGSDACDVEVAAQIATMCGGRVIEVNSHFAVFSLPRHEESVSAIGRSVCIGNRLAK
jgi:hypothetical protein